MIAALTCFSILILGLCAYSRSSSRKYGVIAFFFLVSDGFNFLSQKSFSGFPINKVSDYAIFFLIAIILLFILNKKNIIKPATESFKWIYVLFGYLTIIFMVTVMIGAEYYNYSLQTWRKYILFLSFIILQPLSTKDLQWVFKCIIGITMFTTFLFVLQPITHIQFLARDTMAEITSNNAFSMRYRNIPYLTYFCLIYYSINVRFYKIKDVFLLLLCLSALVITQHRGIILGYAFCIVLYLLYKRKASQVIAYGIIGSIMLFISGSFILERFNEADTANDFTTLINMDFKNVNAYKEISGEGTLTFRIALFLERAEYLVTHPKNLMTGIGMRHEDSPKTGNDFSFLIGSAKYSNGFWIPMQLTSGDLVWLDPFFKFGLIGLGLYIWITILFAKFYYVNKGKSLFHDSALFFYLLLIIISLKNDILFDKSCLFMIFLTTMIILRNNTNEKRIRINQ